MEEEMMLKSRFSADNNVYVIINLTFLQHGT